MTLMPAGIDSWWVTNNHTVEGVVHAHLEKSFFDTLADQGDLGPVGELPLVHLAQDLFLSGLLQRLGSEVAETEKPSRLLWETFATSMALGLSRLGRPEGDQPAIGRGVGIDRRVIRAIDDLESRLGEDVGLIDLAEAAGLSPSRFATLFRAGTGQTPHQWLLSRRIERASTLLRNTTAPITQIAFDLGFSSSQHFATTFRRHQGVTPSAFRAALRG